MADIDPFARLMRRQEWALYVSSLTSMANHPGQNRDNAERMTDEQIYAKADKHLKAADERFDWSE